MEVSNKLRRQLAFFGVTPENAPEARVAIFTQIHEICFHGQGGYDWNTVYNMPIWLRRFTFSKIKDHNTKENEQINNSTGDKGKKNMIDSSGNINKSEFSKISPNNTKPARYK
jgi:hypothetical protein